MLLIIKFLLIKNLGISFILCRDVIKIIKQKIDISLRLSKHVKLKFYDLGGFFYVA